MKIDKKVLNYNYWYKDINGNVIEQIGNECKIPKNARIYHSIRPLAIVEEISSVDPETRHFGKPTRIVTHIDSGCEKTILEMANSGDYTLSEALYLLSQCCERCTNVLIYKYINGEDGYPEYSEEWHKCNTVCRFCKNENKE